MILVSHPQLGFYLVGCAFGANTFYTAAAVYLEAWRVRVALRFIARSLHRSRLALFFAQRQMSCWGGADC